MNQENISTAIIAIEKAALEKLNKGNPSGYLEIYAENITYFDPFVEKKFNGLKEIKTFYESLQGAIYVEKYEMIAPIVQVYDKIAVLSYNLISYIGSEMFREKCTEVYRKEPDNQWKIIHSHWSVVQPVSTKD